MTTMQNPPQPAQQYNGYPPQFPPPAPAPQPPRRRVGLVSTLGLTSVVAMIAGLSIDEDGANQWSHVHAWGTLAIAAAVLTLAPAFGQSLGLVTERAVALATAGAGGLVLFWVLFTLPYVGSNTSLVTTIGAAAGCAAAWSLPGRAPGRIDPRGW